MSRFRKVDTRIWNDEKFRSLNDDGRLLFLMLLTSPGMTPLGAMKASMAGMAAELGWTPERLREAFREPLRLGMAEVDETAHFVCLPRFLRYNQPENPNVVAAWASSLDLLPECTLKTLTVQRARASLADRPKSFAERFKKSVGEPLRHGLANQEQEPEPEQEQEPVKRALEDKNLASAPARANDIPIDPPLSERHGLEYLIRKGVPESKRPELLAKLMSHRLYLEDIDRARGAA